jgi:DNA polymerase elongation subunit (family B)
MSDKIEIMREFLDNVPDELKKEFKLDLNEEDIKELAEYLVNENGEIISKNELESIMKKVKDEYEFYDAEQYALKINLNSVYGAQILEYFKFSDEWQILGASTTLTGKILSKFGLIETIEKYFNPERETRFEFPLMDNIIVANDDEELFKDPFRQKLRRAIVSDTDSVTPDMVLDTNFGKLFFNEIEKYADVILEDELEDKKYYVFKDMKIKNLVDGNIEMDDVEFIYEHKNEKDIYEIELDDNKVIRVTEDHSIIVVRNGEMIKIKPYELLETDEFVVVE